VSEQPREESGGDAVVGLPSARGAWFRDWRVWLGVLVTIACVWYAARDIPLGDLVAAIREARFAELLLYSAPCYVLAVYFRALRWRHLTNPIAPIPRSVLYRATAIGFMVNNLLPLRVGEFARCWALSRESGVRVGAVFGTVVLERVIDAVSVLLLALGALSLVETGSEAGGVLGQGSRLFLPVALLPLLALVGLRLSPGPALRLTRLLLHRLPFRGASSLESALESFITGLGALSGGRHLFWIGIHSVLIWLLASTGPLLIGIWAFGLDLGSPVQTLLTAWVLLGAIGVAVALPSAPGFIGPYQLAFKAVLVRFGVAPATALAMGALVWVVFWLLFTLQGLLALRASPVALFGPARPDGKASSAPDR